MWSQLNIRNYKGELFYDNSIYNISRTIFNKINYNKQPHITMEAVLFCKATVENQCKENPDRAHGSKWTRFSVLVRQNCLPIRVLFQWHQIIYFETPALWILIKTSSGCSFGKGLRCLSKSLLGNHIPYHSQDSWL